MVIALPDLRTTAYTKTTLQRFSSRFDPLFSADTVSAPAPNLEDQRSEVTRAVDAGGCSRADLSPHELAGISATLRETPSDDGSFVFDAIRTTSREPVLIGVRPASAKAQRAMVAVDIGTTTVAVYLIDCRTGEMIDAASQLNAQAPFGADVVSRIESESRSRRGAAADAIRKQITRMIRDLAEKHRIFEIDLLGAAVVGNTTMIHFLLGLETRHIAAAPFIPAMTDAIVVRGSEIGIDVSSGFRVHVLPAISAYIGSDIIAGVTASRLFRSKRLTLFIDIGTNGEIVLGNKTRLLACSTAAGPAFEGATIRCGCGGIAGAVASFSRRRATTQYATIANEAPVGICGAGVVDVLRVLLDDGVVDETGRMLPVDEALETVPSDARTLYEKRITTIDAAPAFIVVPADETTSGEPIVFTQGDAREVQLAKAAIAAGVDTLLDEWGVGPEALDRVYLAGGFGSFIDIGAAARLGLIPRESERKTRSLGNAAGTGAAAYLVSDAARVDVEKVRAATQYIELSSSMKFMEAYVERMAFPV
ncbi:MAG: DUF4445 domain-containing protein [Spirochaetaceae bacterium]|nr:MAG: DUF4445 domain-containing protein [Spirochaetaceae bacterium]